MPRTPISLRVSLLTLALMFSAAATRALAAEEATASPTPEQEQQFADTLSGATLVGYYTAAGKEQNGLKEERYTISKVTKLEGDTWLFQVRIQYGDHDATLPLPLTVKWAGDTPVITLTDMLVPGFGSFTSRVVIYRGQYAGTWSGGDHGGHLFGRIERTAPAAESAE